MGALWRPRVSSGVVFLYPPRCRHSVPSQSSCQKFKLLKEPNSLPPCDLHSVRANGRRVASSCCITSRRGSGTTALHHSRPWSGRNAGDHGQPNSLDIYLLLLFYGPCFALCHNAGHTKLIDGNEERLTTQDPEGWQRPRRLLSCRSRSRGLAR